MELFNKKYISLVRGLSGSKFWDLQRKHMHAFGMDDMYLLYFSNGLSIHVFSTLRIVIGNKILLNTSDEAFTTDFREYPGEYMEN